MPFSVGEPLTWRLAVELVRRHPDELWLVRTYPMDGQYDCLTVRRLAAPMIGPSIQLNRLGTHVSIDWFGPKQHAPANIPIASWGDPLLDTDPLQWSRMVEQLAGLDSTRSMPPSTPSSIALRWITAFLTAQIGSRDR